MIIKQRNIPALIFFTLISGGIYFLYWVVQTKNELNRIGGQIPTAWLFIMAPAFWYFIYKYTYYFSQLIKKDHNYLPYFILFNLPGVIAGSLYLPLRATPYMSNTSISLAQCLNDHTSYAYMLLLWIGFLLLLITPMVMVQQALNKHANNR